MSDYTYLMHHGIKGQERPNHKYISRQLTGNGWRYIYDKIGIDAKKKRDLAHRIYESDNAIAREAEEDVREYLIKDSRNYRYLQRKASEAAKQALDSHAEYYIAQLEYEKTLLGKIEIPRIGFSSVVIKENTYHAMDLGVIISYGEALNEPGGFIISGHNYRGGSSFMYDIRNLESVDKIYITDLRGEQVEYTIYNKYETTDDDFSYATRNTNGKREISLSTCRSLNL